MSSIISSTLFLLLSTALAHPYASGAHGAAPAAGPPPTIPVPQSAALNSKCAPGGNFDLANWTLQLPTGTPGHMDSVSGKKLEGCSGWQNEYFRTANDGSLAMYVPSRSQCVTSPNSKHCRTELREQNPKSWDPKTSVNRLKAKLSFSRVDESKYGTVIGQVKVDDSVSKKPLCELFVNQDGDVTMGVSQIPDVSSLKMTKVGKVSWSNVFTYEIRYEKSVLSVSIDGGEFQTLSTGSLNAPPSYFKAGNYNQGNEPSLVYFHSIEVQHS